MLKRLENYGGEAVFAYDVVRILTAAFDDAWKSIQEVVMTFPSDRHADATRELLALRIIETARLGERDQRRLRDDAPAESDLRSTRL